LGANAADPDAIRNLQRDLDKIGKWSDKWLIQFNTDKCKVMHIGNANPGGNYMLLGSQIQTTNLENTCEFVLVVLHIMHISGENGSKTLRLY
jgi:hypothetical protein